MLSRRVVFGRSQRTARKRPNTGRKFNESKSRVALSRGSCGNLRNFVRAEFQRSQYRHDHVAAAEKHQPASGRCDQTEGRKPGLAKRGIVAGKVEGSLFSLIHGSWDLYPARRGFLISRCQFQSKQRERYMAEQKIEAGKAISRDELAELLNEDLSREYQAIISYVVYSQVLKGAEYMSIADQLELHAQQELKHALIISRQIDYLGKMPTVNAKPVRTSDKAKDMLRFDLENENETIRNYRERVR
jgi:hypothetical protein